MNTNTLAAGVIGFLLGGFTVSIAAELEDDGATAPLHNSMSHQSLLVDEHPDARRGPVAALFRPGG